MKRLLVAALAAIIVGGAAYATAPMQIPAPAGTAQASYDQLIDRGSAQIRVEPMIMTAQAKETTRVETSAPVTSTTTVKGGDLAASVIEWLKVAFGTAISGVLLALLYKVFGYFGIQTTEMQRAQLQAVVVNGLNAAAARAQVSLRGTDKLDYTTKSQIVGEAVEYAQNHASDTIKALGLDPKSGDAVAAIRARIETAINDPATPTPPAITPTTGGGVVNPSQPLAPRGA